jgi:hypothetical protein
MSDTLLRTVNLQFDVHEIIQAEAIRRRNGGKGFSLTLNQIVLEWLDGYNAGLLPLDKRELQDMPAVRKANNIPFTGKGDEIGDAFGKAGRI